MVGRIEGDPGHIIEMVVSEALNNTRAFPLVRETKMNFIRNFHRKDRENLMMHVAIDHLI